MAGRDLRVPELSGGVDIRTLPLTAIDGFVLSRVDGNSSSSDIVAMTGLPAEQVQEILDRLVQHGAIRWRGEPARPSMASPSHPPGASSPPRASSLAPPSSTSPPRRRPSWSQPRKVFSESSISSPPPDLRGLSQRPRSPTPNAPSSRVPTPPPLIPPSDFPGAEEPRGRTAPTAAPPPVISILPESADDPTPRTHPTPITASAPPLYDQRELEEQVDLPMERRKQILDLYYRRKELDYYTMLGVAYGAEKKQIRSAYFTLSKAFHPDSMFRKQLGSYKAKMTAVFESLTEAYETLSKAKARAEYDAYLRSTRSIAAVERALAIETEVAVEVPRPPLLPSMPASSDDASSAGPAPEPEPDPLPARAPSSEPTAEARRLAREVMARRMRGLVRGPERRTPNAAGQPPEARMAESGSPPLSERQQLARQLTRTLIGASKVSGGNQVTRLMVLARSALERGDVASAAKNVAEALALAPERDSIRAEHERLSGILAEKLANDYAEHARFEAKQGKWASAAASWSKVCEAKPSDPHAHRLAAHALLKAGGDLRGAQKYAQQAVFLAPEDIDARILLAQIHLTVGLKLNARRELEAAAKLDPENEMVKNLFSELKG